MNVKSFQNIDGVPVNVDLDLVEAVEEAENGQAILHFGPLPVRLGVPYGYILPEITAPSVLQIPLPPPAAPPAENPTGEGEGGDNPPA